MVKRVMVLAAGSDNRSHVVEEKNENYDSYKICFLSMSTAANTK